MKVCVCVCSVHVQYVRIYICPVCSTEGELRESRGVCVHTILIILVFNSEP